MDRVRAEELDNDGSPPDGKVVPFLKWAGGKRWFVQACADLFPRTFRDYVEPFLGSGAVFFHIAPMRGLLSDRNVELIETYLAVRDEWEAVFDELSIHDQRHSETYYYKVRSQKPRTPARKAARFIYLNRTCWNGLYRVNKDGTFNVPVGTKENVVLPTDNFSGVSKQLAKVEIRACDYTDSILKAKSDDFLFVDPPYVTKRHNGAFIKYNERLFSWSDQVVLRDVLLEAKKKGVQILATNANNNLIRKLYENDFDVSTISRASVISGENGGRGRCSELVIRN